MDATGWLRLMVACMANPPVGPQFARVAVLAPRFDVEFPPHAFTADTARRAGKALADGQPTYDAIAAALRFAMPDEAAPRPPAETDEQRLGGHWNNFLARRIREGANKPHLLSLIRAHAPANELPGLVETHFPAEAKAEEARATEVRRDKAKAAERVAAAVGSRLRAAPLFADPAPVQPVPPAPPPTERPEPPPLRLAEQLRRLEIDAASKDPPPNAAARIERLRRQLEQEAPA